MDKKHLIKLISVVGGLALLILIFELSGLRQDFSLSFRRDKIENNLYLGLLIFVALFALGNLIQIPGWIFLAAAVITLGKFNGGIATYIAAVFSCLTTFFIVRFVGQDALRGLNNQLAIKLFNQLDKSPVASIIGLRVVFQTVPVLNYTLALAGVKFRHYLIGTLLGLPVPIFFYCLFFDFLALHVFNISVQ